jgi:hypothetical protein
MLLDRFSVLVRAHSAMDFLVFSSVMKLEIMINQREKSRCTVNLAPEVSSRELKKNLERD